MSDKIDVFVELTPEGPRQLSWEEKIARGDETRLPDEPPMGAFALHRKTHSLYFVLGTATESTNGPEENRVRRVVYFSLKKRRLRTRRLEQFMDGRFLLVTDPDLLRLPESPGRASDDD